MKSLRRRLFGLPIVIVVIVSVAVMLLFNIVVSGYVDNQVEQSMNSFREYHVAMDNLQEKIDKIQSKNGGNDSETTGGDAANTETASSGEETTGETEEERIKPDIPATADYGGDEINFLFWQLSSWMGTVRQCRDIYSEGITGEAINDAVYNRNIKIEDAYKVKIALEMMDLDKISTAISQEVNGGTNTYDVSPQCLHMVWGKSVNFTSRCSDIAIASSFSIIA